MNPAEKALADFLAELRASRQKQGQAAKAVAQAAKERERAMREAEQARQNEQARAADAAKNAERAKRRAEQQRKAAEREVERQRKATQREAARFDVKAARAAEKQREAAKRQAERERRAAARDAERKRKAEQREAEREALRAAFAADERREAEQREADRLYLQQWREHPTRHLEPTPDPKPLTSAGKERERTWREEIDYLRSKLERLPPPPPGVDSWPRLMLRAMEAFEERRQHVDSLYPTDAWRPALASLTRDYGAWVRSFAPKVRRIAAHFSGADDTDDIDAEAVETPA